MDLKLWTKIIQRDNHVPKREQGVHYFVIGSEIWHLLNLRNHVSYPMRGEGAVQFIPLHH